MNTKIMVPYVCFYGVLFLWVSLHIEPDVLVSILGHMPGIATVAYRLNVPRLHVGCRP